MEKSQKMKGKFLENNRVGKSKDGSLLKWKTPNIGRRKEEGNRFSVTQFLQQKGSKEEEDGVMGPGMGFGVGCGIGLGLGMVGGAGVGLPPGINNLKTVFGIGMGCGIGVGFGYGFGYGTGFSFDSVRSRFFKP